ncbi:MAG: TonB family protein [Bryobacterales bacterium]|nr:TonB family protein [Bryobacterales bacterium]
MITLIATAALKGTAVLGAAWIATGLLRRGSADLRHKIWVAALIALAALTIPIAPPQTLRIAIDTSTAGMKAVAVSTRSVSVLPMVWAAIATLLFMRWGAGILRLHRITRGSRLEGGVHVSDAIQTPMTWGVIRPVILVPAYVMDWASQKREIVIRHEQSHIDRHDWLLQSFAQLMTAVFWFHPLVWLASAQLRREAEHAADDVILAAGIEASDYADRLMAVARQFQGGSPVAAITAVTMVRQPALASRISAILDSGRTRARASVGARLGVVLAAVALLVPLSAFQNRTVYRVGQDGVTAPKVIYKVQPQYTPEAKEAKIQGTIKIAAIVNSFGQADNIQVIQSLDPALDAISVAAVSEWLFQPGTKDEQPVDVAVSIEINFKLL